MIAFYYWPTRPWPNRWSLFSHMVSVHPSVRHENKTLMPGKQNRRYKGHHWLWPGGSSQIRWTCTIYYPFFSEKWCDRKRKRFFLQRHFNWRRQELEIGVFATVKWKLKNSTLFWSTRPTTVLIIHILTHFIRTSVQNLAKQNKQDRCHQWSTRLDP